MESSWTIAGIQENEGDGCCFPEKGRQGGAGTESGSFSWRLILPCRSHLFSSFSPFPLPFLSQTVTEEANSAISPSPVFYPVPDSLISVSPTVLSLVSPFPMTFLSPMTGFESILAAYVAYCATDHTSQRCQCDSKCCGGR